MQPGLPTAPSRFSRTGRGALLVSSVSPAQQPLYGTARPILTNTLLLLSPPPIESVLSIFLLTVSWWIPESPRYYVARDQPEKALAILARYHTPDGDEHDEVVQLEFAEITTALAMEKMAAESFKFIDFLKTKGNRHRLVIIICVGLFSQWSGNGLVSYYLNKIMGSIGITDPTRSSSSTGV